MTGKIEDCGCHKKDMFERILERFNMKEGQASHNASWWSLQTQQEFVSFNRRKKTRKWLSFHIRQQWEVSCMQWVCTRPDIAHAVGVVSRFLSNPGKQHWEAVKWIFRYLRRTSKLCLSFGRGKLVLEGYTDADMAGDLDGRKSTSGYLFTFAGGVAVSRTGYATR